MESHEDSNLGESLTRQKSHMNPLAGRAHNETGLTGQRSQVKPLAMPEVAKAMDVSDEPCSPPPPVSQQDHEEPSGPPPAAHSTHEKFQAAPPSLSDPVTTWANQNLRARHSPCITKHMTDCTCEVSAAEHGMYRPRLGSENESGLPKPLPPGQVTIPRGLDVSCNDLAGCFNERAPSIN